SNDIALPGRQIAIEPHLYHLICPASFPQLESGFSICYPCRTSSVCLSRQLVHGTSNRGREVLLQDLNAVRADSREGAFNASVRRGICREVINPVCCEDVCGPCQDRFLRERDCFFIELDWVRAAGPQVHELEHDLTQRDTILRSCPH